MSTNHSFDAIKIAPDRRHGLLLPIVGLWTAGVVAIIALFGFDVLEVGTANANGLGRYYLLPWAAVTGLVVLAPALYYLRKGTFDLFHPLVYGVWSYIFPAFVIGALFITFEMSSPYVMLFVSDPEKNLPLSLICIMIGFVGVVVGYALPVGSFMAKRLSRYAPTADWDLSSLWIPGIVLTLSGVGVNILGLILGVLGFQRVDQIGTFDSFVVFLSYVFNVGYLLLWLAVFQTRERSGLFYLVVVFLVAMIPLRLALQGGRSSLMLTVISIAVAFWYSGRRLKWQHTTIFGLILVVAIFVGVVYGTTFRRIKGSEERMNAGDYVGQVMETVDFLSRTDASVILDDGFSSMAERIDNLSSLGVVVANYEKLAPYEESYGLKDNIRNDLLTAFIPRLVWADKPNTSEPRAYSELYFDYGENSFAITPFGDLLRNFGMVGIPFGMIFIGIYYRLIYDGLINAAQPALWKKVAYYPLLAAISYESFYAHLLPVVLRVAFVVFISLILVNFFARKRPQGDRSASLAVS